MPKPCPPCPIGKICNPRTGKCVNRHGRIGSKIVSPRRASLSPPPYSLGDVGELEEKIAELVISPQLKSKYRLALEAELANLLEDTTVTESIEEYGNGLNKHLPSGYRMDRKIGQGASGKVYRLCKKPSTTRCLNPIAVKLTSDWLENVVEFKKNSETEVERQKLFYSYGLAPEVLFHYYYIHGERVYSVFGMEQVNMLENSLQTDPIGISPKEYCENIMQGLMDLLDKMDEFGLVHDDVSIQNIAFRGWKLGMPYEFILIDFALVERKVGGRTRLLESLWHLDTKTVRCLKKMLGEMRDI